MGQLFRPGESFAGKSFETCQSTLLFSAMGAVAEFCNGQNIQWKRVNPGHTLYSVGKDPLGR
jgi:hypothetical protein